MSNIKDLKTFKACGVTTGHGERCVEGWECSACSRIKSLIEYTDYLEAKLPNDKIVEAQDEFLHLGKHRQW